MPLYYLTINLTFQIDVKILSSKLCIYCSIIFWHYILLFVVLRTCLYLMSDSFYIFIYLRNWNIFPWSIKQNNSYGLRWLKLCGELNIWQKWHRTLKYNFKREKWWAKDNVYAVYIIWQKALCRTHTELL